MMLRDMDEMVYTWPEVLIGGLFVLIAIARLCYRYLW